MIACQVERFNNILHEIEPMIDDHWREVGTFQNEFRRHIHYSDYMILEANGRLLTVTARKDGGQLVGYFVGATANDLHRDTLTDPQKRVPVISALVYYMQPSYRGYGRLLIRTTEREAAERFGAQIISIRVKPGMNRADEFLRALGYTPIEVTYSRLIGEAADAGNRAPRAEASNYALR